MLYVPNISMVIDLFSCSEEVNDSAFFDID